MSKTSDRLDRTECRLDSLEQTAKILGGWENEWRAQWRRTPFVPERIFADIEQLKSDLKTHTHTPTAWVPSVDSHTVRVRMSDVLTLIMDHLGLKYDDAPRMEKEDE